MQKLEVFFDYACPFCLRGYGYLKELISQYPQVEIVWCPCEAHPRPEHYGSHSDLCMQGMLFAQSRDVDLWAYHDRMFQAALTDRADIENVDVLAGYVAGLLNADDFREALRKGEFAKAQQALNDYAYGRNGVWAVPAFRMGGAKLDSVESVGVTKAQLEAFLSVAQAD
jgi:predicted DsbA family dithiol-disulfide isomerase